MADYTIQVSGWWTDEQETDGYVFQLIEDNTPHTDTVPKSYTLAVNQTTYREYDCNWNGSLFSVRFEVV